MTGPSSTHQEREIKATHDTNRTSALGVVESVLLKRIQRT